MFVVFCIDRSQTHQLRKCDQVLISKWKFICSTFCSNSTWVVLLGVTSSITRYHRTHTCEIKKQLPWRLNKPIDRKMSSVCKLSIFVNKQPRNNFIVIHYVQWIWQLDLIFRQLIIIRHLAEPLCWKNNCTGKWGKLLNHLWKHFTQTNISLWPLGEGLGPWVCAMPVWQWEEAALSAVAVWLHSSLTDGQRRSRRRKRIRGYTELSVKCAVGSWSEVCVILIHYYVLFCLKNKRPPHLADIQRHLQDCRSLFEWRANKQITLMRLFLGFCVQKVIFASIAVAVTCSRWRSWGHSNSLIQTSCGRVLLFQGRTLSRGLCYLQTVTLWCCTQYCQLSVFIGETLCCWLAPFTNS